MSDISIVVPLSALPQNTYLTPNGIMSALVNVETVRQQAEDALASAQFYKDAYNELVRSTKSAGASLQLILDEVDGEFERLQALRNFAQEMKNTGSQFREMP